MTLVIIACLVAALVMILRTWIRDLIFYRSCSWDFSKDSGFQMFWGMDGAVGDRMSNKGRVLFGYPFLILITLALISAVNLIGIG
jgi:hypothetical protein